MIRGSSPISVPLCAQINKPGASSSLQGEEVSWNSYCACRERTLNMQGTVKMFLLAEGLNVDNPVI